MLMLLHWVSVRSSHFYKGQNLKFFYCLGTSASDVHFQAFLIEGLVRWNQDREVAATSSSQPSYDKMLIYAVNSLARTVTGQDIVHGFQIPGKYTGV